MHPNKIYNAYLKLRMSQRNTRVKEAYNKLKNYYRTDENQNYKNINLQVAMVAQRTRFAGNVSDARFENTVALFVGFVPFETKMENCPISGIEGEKCQLYLMQAVDIENTIIGIACSYLQQIRHWNNKDLSYTTSCIRFLSQLYMHRHLSFCNNLF